MRDFPGQRIAWLALYLVPGLGNVLAKNLLESFEGPEAIFEATLADLMKVEGITRKVAQKIVKREFALDPERELRKIEKCGAQILTYTDSAYPPLLREIHDPPMLLFTKGKIIPADKAFVAVVGSRNATHYGIKICEQIGWGLARRGFGVASGLARGIDSAAHWGCLRGQGFTVAVLGTGIDLVYPEANKDLFDAVVENGAVVSEFPVGTHPEGRNFPIRNRIISGMSKGVVVVEATKRSGSLITASVALEQGREVFAVPGSIDSFKSTGTHSLIKQGAKLVEHVDDIVDEIGLRDSVESNEYGSLEDTRPSIDMTDFEKSIYDLIEDYPIHIDEIARMLHMDAREALSTLMTMELKGIIRQLPGKMYVR
jgi:DNA processing protein